MKSKRNITGNPLLRQQNSREVRKLERAYKAARADFEAVWLPKADEAEQVQSEIKRLEAKRADLIDELKRGLLAKTALESLRIRLETARKRAAMETISMRPRTRQRAASARGKAL